MYVHFESLFWSVLDCVFVAIVGGSYNVDEANEQPFRVNLAYFNPENNSALKAVKTMDVSEDEALDSQNDLKEPLELEQSNALPESTASG